MRIEEREIDKGVEKLIIVSDFHGTLPVLPALDRILGDMTEKVQVIADGDYVVNGPNPVEVIDWVRANCGEFAVLGNHDDGAAHSEEGDFPSYTEEGAFNRLDSGLREYLSGLPHMLELSWQGAKIRVTHDKSADGVSFSWKARESEVVDLLVDESVDLTVSAHTHYPFVRDDVGVANTGSTSVLIVGHTRKDGGIDGKGDAPFEALPEIYSTYLSIVMVNGKPKATVEKFNYDVELAVRLIVESGNPNAERLAKFYRTGVCWE